MHEGVDAQAGVSQHHVFSLMAKVGRTFTRDLDRHLALVGLTSREHELLTLIRAGETLGPGELARACSVSRQVVHRHLGELEARRLVQRWRRGYGDVCVGISPAGAALLEEADAVVESFRGALLSRFGVQHHAALRSLLEELQRLLSTASRHPHLLDE